MVKTMERPKSKQKQSQSAIKMLGLVSADKEVYSRTSFKRFSDVESVKNFLNGYIKWMNTLSADQYLSLLEYTQSAYVNINAVLRGKSAEFEGDNEKHCKSLHEALNKSIIDRNIIVYRGMSRAALGPYASLNPKQLVGKVIKDKGFMSTTLLTNAIPNDDIVLTIKVPNGTSGAPVSIISSHKSETEVLLNKGQQMVITHVSDDGSKIECEII